MPLNTHSEIDAHDAAASVLWEWVWFVNKLLRFRMPLPIIVQENYPIVHRIRPDAVGQQRNRITAYRVVFPLVRYSGIRELLCLVVVAWIAGNAES